MISYFWRTWTGARHAKHQRKLHFVEWDNWSGNHLKAVVIPTNTDWKIAVTRLGDSLDLVDGEMFRYFLCMKFIQGGSENISLRHSVTFLRSHFFIEKQLNQLLTNVLL